MVRFPTLSENTPSVDHPLVANELSRGLELSRVSRRNIGLGHGKRRPDVSSNNAAQVTALLVLGSVTEHHERVLQRVRSQAKLPKLTPSLNFIDKNVVHESEALAAEFDRMTDGPEVLLLGFGLGAPDPFPALLCRETVVLVVKQGFKWVDVLFHELEDLFAEGLDVVRNLEPEGRLSRLGDLARRRDGLVWRDLILLLLLFFDGKLAVELHEAGHRGGFEVGFRCDEQCLPLFALAVCLCEKRVNCLEHILLGCFDAERHGWIGSWLVGCRAR